MRRARALALVSVALALAACASRPAVDVREPRPYPDRTSAEACWETFLWAWRSGDVPVLEQTYALWEKERLVAEIEKQGRAKVAEFYRKDAEKLVLEDARWDSRTDDLAYLTVKLGKRGETAAPTPVRFSFLRRDDGWCVSGRN